MFRIRIHGRGGQGIKMASRVLGSALFRAGFTVQDAPKYGAERRGAPIYACVRAARQPINERGAITRPDLVVVADDTLLAVPAAGTLQGIDRVIPTDIYVAGCPPTPENLFHGLLKLQEKIDRSAKSSKPYDAVLLISEGYMARRGILPRRARAV